MEGNKISKACSRWYVFKEGLSEVTFCETKEKSSINFFATKSFFFHYKLTHNLEVT